MISNAPVPVELGLPTTIFPEGDVRLSKSPYSVASEMKEPVVSNDAFSSGEELVEIPFRLKGLYPPSNVWEPMISIHMSKKKRNRNTYHVVSDQFEMTNIDIDFVCIEDTADLAQNSLPGGLNAIRTEEAIDIVWVDAVFVNHRVLFATSELPEAAEVGAVGCELTKKDKQPK
jgi:hypothetical protein